MKGDLLLQQITDFVAFDRKMSDNPENMMPDLFLKDELQIERWNNIPLPLMKLAE